MKLQLVSVLTTLVISMFVAAAIVYENTPNPASGSYVSASGELVTP